MAGVGADLGAQEALGLEDGPVVDLFNKVSTLLVPSVDLSILFEDIDGLDRAVLIIHPGDLLGNLLNGPLNLLPLLLRLRPIKILAQLAPAFMFQLLDALLLCDCRRRCFPYLVPVDPPGPELRIALESRVSSRPLVAAWGCSLLRLLLPLSLRGGSSLGFSRTWPKTLEGLVDSARDLALVVRSVVR